MSHLVSLAFKFLSAWSVPHFTSNFKRLRCCSLSTNNFLCAFLKHKFHMQDVSARQHKTQTRWTNSGYELKAIMRTANNKRNTLLIAPSREKDTVPGKTCSFNSQMESDTAAKYQPNKQEAANLLGMLSPPKGWLMTRSNANCLHWIPGRANPGSSTFLGFYFIFMVVKVTHQTQTWIQYQAFLFTVQCIK